jgi:thiosulfate dehydrogenase (quinone) large subunit
MALECGNNLRTGALRMAARTKPACIPIHQRYICILRIAFGVTWAVAAWLKWQPAFRSAFAATVKGAIEGQPYAIQAWIGFWLRIIDLNPTLFAALEATMETLLALCFLLGLFTNIACVVGMLLSLGIWSIPEGFGGPYIAGHSTDIGTAFPYAILCALLLCANAGRYYALDRLLLFRLKHLSFLTKSHTEEIKVEEKVPSFAGKRKVDFM